MAIWHLEIKHIRVKHLPVFSCPNPQYNNECMGYYLHTRRYQKECVACMKLHHTINKHPLLAILISKKSLYPEYDILEI